jgi:hypothetical protein
MEEGRMSRGRPVEPGFGSSEGTGSPETQAGHETGHGPEAWPADDDRRAFVVTVRDGPESRVYRAMLSLKGGVWSAEARHCENAPGQPGNRSC